MSVGNPHRLEGAITAQSRVVERLVGWCPHIFMAILVHGEMDGAKGPAANLLFHQILVDAVLCGAVIFAVAVL